MNTKTLIEVKKSGPSKNKPDKYGWILDINEKFWNVTLAQAQAARPGTRWEVESHVNPKGYEDVVAIKPSGGSVYPDAPVISSAPIKSNGGPEKGMLMKEAVALLVAGKSIAEAVEILLQADSVYQEFIAVRDGQPEA